MILQYNELPEHESLSRSWKYVQCFFHKEYVEYIILLNIQRTELHDGQRYKWVTEFLRLK